MQWTIQKAAPGVHRQVDTIVALGGHLYVYGGVRAMRDGTDTILSDVLVARAQGGVVKQPWRRLAIGESAPSQSFLLHALGNAGATAHGITGLVAEVEAATAQERPRDCLQSACHLSAWRPVSLVMKAQRDASACTSLEACGSKMAPPTSEAAAPNQMLHESVCLPVHIIVSQSWHYSRHYMRRPPGCTKRVSFQLLWCEPAEML